jgi:hypothetical protein
MASTIEKPAETTTTEHVEEKKVEKEPEPTTTTTTTDETTSTDNNDGNGHTGEENGNGHTEEENNVQLESSNVDDAEEKDEPTLKRKDAPADTDEFTKKQKLVDSEEKEAEPTATSAEV